jgi:hypothetical protein
MKLIILFISLASVLTTKCSRTKKVTGIPFCIQKKIDSIKAQPRWNPPATVYEYTYKSQTVYLFSADCCDQFSALYATDCQLICAPSGGITGKGDGKCIDFNAEAKEVKLVWKDPR